MFGAGGMGSNPYGGMGGLGGAAELMNNPEMMRQMMDSPMMRSLLDNPELMRSMMMSNPMMRNMMERNPEMARVMSDPAVIRQSMEAMRNPGVMREMTRSSDRAMHNAATSAEGLSAEGFSALRQMYSDMDASMSAASEEAASSAPPGSAGRLCLVHWLDIYELLYLQTVVIYID
jgi:ubiquilin